MTAIVPLMLSACAGVCTKASRKFQCNSAQACLCLYVQIERKYTPVTGDDTPGHVDLVIKVYKSGAVDRFPDGGKMSQYMGNLKVGDTMTISGPWGIINYIGGGVFKYGSSKVLECKHIGMMAGGTGLTPMLQIVQAVWRPPSHTAPHHTAPQTRELQPNCSVLPSESAYA